MNFQAVDNQFSADNGKNSVRIQGTLLEIKGQGLTKNGKPYTDVQVQDGNGVKHKVRLYGDKMPTVQNLNTQHFFDISAYKGDYQGKPYTGYSGFWGGLSTGTVQSTQPQSTAPAQRQAASSGKQEPDWDKIAEGKVRSIIVCAGIQSGQLECKTPAAVDYWTDFVMRHEDIQKETENGPDYLPEDTTDYSQEPAWMQEP